MHNPIRMPPTSWITTRKIMGVVLPGMFMLIISLVGLRLSTEARINQETLRNRQQQLLNMVDSSRAAQLYYNNQQESWRKLDGAQNNPDEFAHHLREYKATENLVTRQLDLLRQSLEKLSLDARLTDRIMAQHAQLGEKHEESVTAFRDNDLDQWQALFESAWGLEQQIRNRFGTLIGEIVFEATQKITQQNELSEQNWQRTRSTLIWITAIGVAFTSWIGWLMQTANQRQSEALQTLNLAKEELVRSEKLAALGALVAGVAHELNTPIGNSITVASSLKQNVQDIIKHKQNGTLTSTEFDTFCIQAEEGYQLLESSLHRAVEIVGNFKQVAVDQSSDRRRSYDLKTVIEEITRTLRHQFKHTPYTLDAAIPDNIEMNGYPGALGQILNNLILNALKHAFDDRSEGRVSVTAELVGEERVLISVTDDGNGIPAQLRNKVFDPFYTTKMGKGGSGLGLYIVHNLATATMGGNLTLECGESNGTTFKLDIPREAPVKKETA